MAKTKTTFFLSNCGTQPCKMVGQCGACKEWNTIIEEVIQKEEKRVWKQATTAKKTINKPLKVADIQLNPEERIVNQQHRIRHGLRWRIGERFYNTIGRRTRYWKIDLITASCFKHPSKSIVRVGRRKSISNKNESRKT